MQIISLYAFILQAIHEKLQASPKTKQKRKQNAEVEKVISEKERCQLIIELMRQLKLEIKRCDKLLSKYRTNRTIK